MFEDGHWYKIDDTNCRGQCARYDSKKIVDFFKSIWKILDDFLNRGTKQNKIICHSVANIDEHVALIECHLKLLNYSSILSNEGILALQHMYWFAKIYKLLYYI